MVKDMTDKIFSEIKSFIKEIGFPIGVSIWLLWQAQTTMNELNRSLSQLTVTMQALREDIGKRQ